MILYGCGMTEIEPAAILKVAGLRFAWPDEPAPVLCGSFSVGAGVTQLFGDTGSGKSTLLRVIAGALPGTGELAIDGVSAAEQPARYRQKLFFCDPATDRFDQVTGRDCTATLSDGDSNFDRSTWQRVVDRFSLAQHIDKPMYMLSTGTRRKVWLAAALASGRPLVLLDEPKGGLDLGSLRCLWATLAEQSSRAGRAVLVASSERIDSIPLAGVVELPLVSHEDASLKRRCQP